MAFIFKRLLLMSLKFSITDDCKSAAILSGDFSDTALSTNIIETLNTNKKIAKCKKLICKTESSHGCNETPIFLSISINNRTKPIDSPITNEIIAVLELIFFENRPNKNTAVIGGATNACTLCKKR